MKNKNYLEKVLINSFAFLLVSFGITMMILSFSFMCDTIKKIEIYTK